MALFDFLKKKEIKFNPSGEYFFDILSDTGRISVQSSTHGKTLDAYYNTPQLANIINYSAKIYARNDLRHYNTEGEQTDDPIIDLFENPHPLYSEGEFWETFYKQYEIFNIVLTYKVSGVGGVVSGLYVLPYQLINIIPKEGLKPIDILLAQDITDVIDYYELSFNNKKYKLPVEDVWMLSGSGLKFDNGGYLEPDNIIDTLYYPIKNIQANYEARYSLVENRGMLGMWVNQSTDSGSFVPVSDGDKKSLYKTIRQTFGMTKGRQLVGITDANLKFESAALPVKDLELNQGIAQDKITIADAYQFPILLLNELEGSTFNNLETADRNLYTKKIIPGWDLISKSITKEFELQGYVEFYTNDIEVLKKDDKVEAETNQINTNTVISINNAVLSGVMTYDNAVQTLVLIADVPEEVAKEVITTNIKPNETEPL